ncbi:unnamed protein product, partial [Mesorhabditis belari]|uniref:NADH dehydrogenase [ubiquinone] iron-sulfur protein 4, mitochondrial n=1 Tax=Mesorhabditis belari TaxID=2138241 RepID=A0AAF3J5F3_9BILA
MGQGTSRNETAIQRKMLRRVFVAGTQTCRGIASTRGDLPIPAHGDAKRKSVELILGEAEAKAPVTVATEESSAISGVPEEHQFGRTVRIFRPTREATQTAWNNTKLWKIEIDNRERWENSLMGWISTGDPLSNTSMQLDFASKEDAIAFCEKNNWTWELEKEQIREIKPKSYGWNYSWNKRCRNSTK